MLGKVAVNSRPSTVTDGTADGGYPRPPRRDANCGPRARRWPSPVAAPADHSNGSSISSRKPASTVTSRVTFVPGSPPGRWAVTR